MAFVEPKVFQMKAHTSDKSNQELYAEIEAFLIDTRLLTNSDEAVKLNQKSVFWNKKDYASIGAFIREYETRQDVGDEEGRRIYRDVIETAIDDICFCYDWSWNRDSLELRTQAIYWLASVRMYLDKTNKALIYCLTDVEARDLIAQAREVSAMDRIESADPRVIANYDELRNRLVDTLETLTQKYYYINQLNKEPVPKSTSQLKTEATNATYRIAARQINRGTGKVFSSVLPEGKGQEFVSSEFGQALVSMVSGLAMTQLAKGNEKASKLADELRIGAITVAGNFLADEVMSMLVGVIGEAVKGLPAEDSEEEIATVIEEDIGAKLSI